MARDRSGGSRSRRRREPRPARGGSRSRSRLCRERKARKRDKEKAVPHFSWKPGMCLGTNDRYVVEQFLGDGTFGRVLGCKDSVAQDYVAVKVVKGVKRYCEHAEAEVEILQEIQRLDPRRESLCVEMLDSFLHAERHLCIVFEPLDTSIRDFLKENDNLGMLLADVRLLAQQLLQSLRFLHGIGLTHTDLKCRNVMLRDGSHDVVPHPRMEGRETRRLRSCRLAVIDFGGAVFPDERHPGQVGTRQYRAPEIVLGLPWDESSDIWSAGCIVAMLYLGQRPLSMHENMEHLAMIERLLETEIPLWMVRQALEQDKPLDGIAFDREGRLQWPAAAPDGGAVERVCALQALRQRLAPHHGALLGLLKGLLEVCPRARLTAAAALQCKFFTNEEVVE